MRRLLLAALLPLALAGCDQAASGPPAAPTPRPAMPTLGGPEAAFTAYYGGVDRLGRGYYRRCALIDNNGLSLPSLHVTFDDDGKASVIVWDGCTSESGTTWRKAAQSFLPPGAVVTDTQPGFGDDAILSYRSPALGVVTLSGGPGLHFDLLVGTP